MTADQDAVRRPDGDPAAGPADRAPDAAGSHATASRANADTDTASGAGTAAGTASGTGTAADTGTASGAAADTAAESGATQGAGGYGDPRVDSAMARLESSGEGTAAEQVAEYEAVHRVLQDTLATIDEA